MSQCEWDSCWTAGKEWAVRQDGAVFWSVWTPWLWIWRGNTLQKGEHWVRVSTDKPYRCSHTAVPQLCSEHNLFKLSISNVWAVWALSFCSLDVGAHFCINAISCGALHTDRKANKTQWGGNHRFGFVCVPECVCLSVCGAASSQRSHSAYLARVNLNMQSDKENNKKKGLKTFVMTVTNSTGFLK